jgi:hypothetical protein
MGMFDTVVAQCVMCNEDISVQSKSGECSLDSYDLNDVPLSIASELHGAEENCFKCSYVNTFEIESVIKTTRMTVT